MSQLTNHSTIYNYHGIFTELHRSIAANVIIRYWRRCRYNPCFRMNTKIELDGLDVICGEENIVIEETEHNRFKQFRLGLRQKDFQKDLEITKKVLRNQERLSYIINKRIIIKPRRRQGLSVKN